MRLALQSNNSGAWQTGYAQQAGQETGGQDFLNGRFSRLVNSTDKFKALLTLNGWKDKGYNEAGQPLRSRRRAQPRDADICARLSGCAAQ